MGARGGAGGAQPVRVVDRLALPELDEGVAEASLAEGGEIADLGPLPGGGDGSLCGGVCGGFCSGLCNTIGIITDIAT